MSRYIFPGHACFVDAAAAESGHPETAGAARRVAPLTSVAGLCAQAAHGEPSHAGAILAEAAAFRDQIATALRAAELMIAAVEDALTAPPAPIADESNPGPIEPERDPS